MFCGIIQKTCMKLGVLSVVFFYVFFTTGVCNSEENYLSAGHKAPQFSLIDTNNISWISKNFFNNDRLVIFYFFDIESEACRQELKFLSTINKENADDVDILAITSNASDELSYFIRNEKLNLTILVDRDRKVSALYNAMSVFPTTFFIDAKGDIVEVVVGSPGDTEAILSLLLNTDKKKVQRQAAVEKTVVTVPPKKDIGKNMQKRATAGVLKSSAKQKSTELALAKSKKNNYTSYTDGKAKPKAGKKRVPKEIARYINDLKNGDLASMRNAARNIFKGHVSHPKLFKTLSSELMQGIRVNDSDKLKVDTMAWLCKALAVSGMPQTIDVLNEVVAGTSSRKIKKYAVKSLQIYERSQDGF